ncbi:hypothetical protein E3N88_05819 [Mikania micrantha]|uniref:Uncharacterized protein n=1 Tax=Mikania micrantha TaxID=192012 RepID=A0A5N6PM13_9ASTR|nr:hypothetical protein E3N88_05819 [Mikania micrantha]
MKPEVCPVAHHRRVSTAITIRTTATVIPFTPCLRTGHRSRKNARTAGAGIYQAIHDTTILYYQIASPPCPMVAGVLSSDVAGEPEETHPRGGGDGQEGKGCGCWSIIISLGERGKC